ncbi:MAG: hypothetical protein K0U54_11040 [Bacteroidetes bacterium]|nr:hypothetical protein [Bacteroidota bacterium]
MNRQVKLLIPILILIGFFLVGYFNKYAIKNYFDSKDRIYWSKDVSITYNDYQDSPNANYNTSPFHGLNLSTDNIKDAYVRAFFDKSQSWAKDTLAYNFKKENELQQLRFNLYEAYARKFNAKIDLIRNERSTSIRNLEAIGDALYSELRVIDDLLFNESLSVDERLQLYRPLVDSLLTASDK